MIWQLIDSSGVGGAERHVATLAAALQRRGLDCRVVLYQDHGPNPWLGQLASAGLTPLVLGGSMRSLHAALRRERPALLHTHGYKAGVLGRLAARMAGVPVVSTFHSGARGAMPVAAYERLDEWTSFLGRRIAVSDGIAARLPFAAAVVPSWVHVPDEAPAGPLPRRVGFLGRLGHEKGPDLFCALAARVGTVEIGWHVYGDGPMRAELEARYGTVVRFHGVVTDVARIWPTLGLLAMPSRFEGVPLAALEAMAAGVPVLASEVGGLPTVVRDGKTGWLVPPGDLDAAADAVRRWLQLGEARQLALRAACRAHVAAAFGEDERMAEILAIYREAGIGSPAAR